MSKEKIIECMNTNCGTPIRIFSRTNEEWIFCCYNCLQEYIEDKEKSDDCVIPRKVIEEKIREFNEGEKGLLKRK